MEIWSQWFGQVSLAPQFLPVCAHRGSKHPNLVVSPNCVVQWESKHNMSSSLVLENWGTQALPDSVLCNPNQHITTLWEGWGWRISHDSWILSQSSQSHMAASTHSWEAAPCAFRTCTVVHNPVGGRSWGKLHCF
jgi:hypothetical protein